MEDMELSFCIITAGKRPELFRLVIESIRAQRIPTFEIIVVGRPVPEPGIVCLEAPDAADAGRLGEMRNLAAAQAQYENIVMLDDDIVLSTRWYDDLLAYNQDFAILTSQVRSPDGSRFCDHVTLTKSRGHRILAEAEDGDQLYMTGGGGWVMKRRVAELVQWDDERVINEAEDVDFSLRCQAAGFKIAHNHKMVVFHADARYTCVGRATLRRSEDRSHEWIQSVLNGSGRAKIAGHSLNLWLHGQRAEAADALRTGLLRYPYNPVLQMLWQVIVLRYGGKLPGNRWFPHGDPEYLDTLERYRGVALPKPGL